MSSNNNSNVINFSLVSNSKAYSLLWVLAFALLTAIAAQFAIPVKPVPFTLQTIFVVLAGACLGAKKGAYSQVLYLSLGVLGLPIFAMVPDAPMGFARLFGPTGGYLLAFPFAAFVAGYIIEKKQSLLNISLAVIVSNLIILFIGIAYLDIVYVRDFQEAIMLGGTVFSFWTLVKAILTIGIFYGIKKHFYNK